VSTFTWLWAGPFHKGLDEAVAQLGLWLSLLHLCPKLQKHSVDISPSWLKDKGRTVNDLWRLCSWAFSPSARHLPLLRDKLPSLAGQGRMGLVSVRLQGRVLPTHHQTVHTPPPTALFSVNVSLSLSLSLSLTHTHTHTHTHTPYPPVLLPASPVLSF
jgi:hypothetical protein